MTIIKSFTDIPQSKKLAEILPIESADMHYLLIGDIDSGNIICSDICPIEVGKPYNKLTLPAWSLAALLGVLPEKYTELIKEGGMYRIIIKDSYMTSLFYNPVDACVAMIEKLHGLKML